LISVIMKSEVLLGRIGVIADVQYVDQEDGFDFSGVQRRRYRNSLKVLQRAVRHWNSIGHVSVVAQLGDLLDVKNTTGEGGKRDGNTSLEALAKVQSVLSESACKEFVNIIGNHELYNFTRSKLDEVLDVKRGGVNTWHSFLPLADSKVRLVVLDPYQVSTIEGSTQENTKAAFDYLRKHNANDITKMGVNWSAGLEGLDRRFMPYNGIVAQDQLAWLDKTLEEAGCSGERVIILSHIPFCPEACDPVCLLWNYEQVLGVLDSHPGTVCAVLSGHDHEGGSLNRDGVWHITMPSPLLVDGDGDCWATINLFEDRIEWIGNGARMPDHIDIPLNK